MRRYHVGIASVWISRIVFLGSIQGGYAGFC
ncbi:YSIRK-type signal peptide-containing protein [Shimia aestuarii]